jgi:hypothetical protein
MVTRQIPAQMWARVELLRKRRRRIDPVAVERLSERDTSTLRAALGILEAHDAFLDMLSAEKNNRDAMKPRDFRIEFTTFYLQNRAINKHRK